MLFSLKDTLEYRLFAEGEAFGDIKALIIDDDQWVVRYLVADVGSRQVLLGTRALGKPDPRSRSLALNISKESVINSPDIDLDKHLSRSFERDLYDYYQWPYYWNPDEVPDTLPGDLSSVPLIEMELDRQDREQIPKTGGETQPQFHLRSTTEIFGYAIFTTNDDRNAGRLVDMVANDQDWNILYLVVDTGGLLPGKKVLVSPTWVQRVDEQNAGLLVNLTRETIHNSPAFNTLDDLTPGYETRLRDHFNRR